MKPLGRLMTAMVTPFSADGKVNYDEAKKLALALINSGSDGLVITGTTGESPTVTKEERLRLFREIKSAVGDKGCVVANTGNYSTAESIELTKEAEKIGVDACLLVVPYYNKPTQEGLFLHFKAIAESTSLPCILYNVPSRTITNLEPETIVKLSQVKNIVGVKEASGNMEKISRIISGTPDEFLVWSGNDGDTLYVMVVGGYGVISVVSHIVGKQLKAIIENVLGGKITEASRIHHALLPLINALFITANPIPVKYAVNQVGFNVGKPRLPLTEPDEKTAAIIKEALKKQKIDLTV